MFRVKLVLSSSCKRWWPSIDWLKRCGAFLMLLKIWRTLDVRCRSKLDELIAATDCRPPLLPLSKMVGIALLLGPKPVALLENKFNSLFEDDDGPLWDEWRRLRNDNDRKRCSLDGSFGGVDGGFCRSSNEDTNWSNTFKSALILEFRTADAFGGLLPLTFAFGGIPRRLVIWKMYKEKIESKYLCRILTLLTRLNNGTCYISLEYWQKCVNFYAVRCM